MCYTTIVLDPKLADLEGVGCYEIETAMGVQRFAQNPKGVLPALLEDLAQFRKQAKKDMARAKQAGDEWGASMYNGKQLAYKITMNSTYGFVGATKGMLPMVPIAASVTATGRNMIQQTKALAEKLVPGSRVIYGDTDSVMVIFNVGEDKRHDLRAHFELAERVSKEISATFKAPNDLEFEKCYYPYLLFSKKRYAGEYAPGEFFSRVVAYHHEHPGTRAGSVPPGRPGRRPVRLQAVPTPGPPGRERLVQAHQALPGAARPVHRAHFLFPRPVACHLVPHGRGRRLRGHAGHAHPPLVTFASLMHVAPQA